MFSHILIHTKFHTILLKGIYQNNLEKLLKKPFASPSGKRGKKIKEKKNWNDNWKLFPFHANAVKDIFCNN